MKYHGHAVEGGALKYVSVSSMRLFEACPRRWWYRYVAGIKEPTTKAQMTGTVEHEQLAHYLSTGEDVLGEIAQGGRRFLPPPAPARREPSTVMVEQEMEPALLIEGVPLIGSIDLLDIERLGDGFAHITDHKTSSDPDRWASTPAQLERDIQGIGYAAWAFDRYPTAEQVVFRHITYATRRKGYAKAAHCVFFRSAHPERMLRLGQLVRGMKLAAAIADPGLVLANNQPEVCNSYNKLCHYAGQCSAYKKESMMSLLDQLLEQESVSKPVSVPVVVQKIPEAGVPVSKLTDEDGVDGPFERALLLPPDAPKVPANPTTPRKPRKAAVAAAVPEPVLPPPPEPASSTAETPAVIPEPVQFPVGALMVFIDCRPRDGQPVSLLLYVAKVQAEAASQAGVADYGLIEFGKGPGIVRAVTRRMPPTGACYINTGWGPGAKAVAEVLREIALSVAEGDPR